MKNNMDFEKLEQELRNDRLQKGMKGFATVVCGFYTGCKEHGGISTGTAQIFTSYLISAMFKAKKDELEVKEIKMSTDDDEDMDKPDLKEIEEQQKSFADMVCNYYLECRLKKNITLSEARELTKSFIFGLFS